MLFLFPYKIVTYYSLALHFLPFISISLSLSQSLSVFRRSVFISYMERSTPVLFSPLLIRENLYDFVRLYPYFEHKSGFYFC